MREGPPNRRSKRSRRRDPRASHVHVACLPRRPSPPFLPPPFEAPPRTVRKGPPIGTVPGSSLSDPPGSIRWKVPFFLPPVRIGGHVPFRKGVVGTIPSGFDGAGGGSRERGSNAAGVRPRAPSAWLSHRSGRGKEWTRLPDVRRDPRALREGEREFALPCVLLRRSREGVRSSEKGDGVRPVPQDPQRSSDRMDRLVGRRETVQASKEVPVRSGGRMRCPFPRERAPRACWKITRIS